MKEAMDILFGFMVTTQQASENLMTYVGRPTPEQAARWAHSPSPPPPPPSYTSDPPPPIGIGWLPHLYNPKAEATPYFSMGMALCGFVCIAVASVAISRNQSLQEENRTIIQQRDDLLKERNQQTQEEREAILQREVEKEFNLFPLESFQKPTNKPSRYVPNIHKAPQAPYIPWPLELEEEGAEPIHRLPC